jgi:hypothetical protein
MADEIHPIPLTLEVIVNASELLSRLRPRKIEVPLRARVNFPGLPDANLLVVDYTVNWNFILVPRGRIRLSEADKRSFQPVKHDPGRSALEMILVHEVYRRVGLIIDSLAKQPENLSEYRPGSLDNALGEPVIGALNLEQGWRGGGSSHDIFFDIFEIGLDSPISVKAAAVVMGTTLLLATNFLIWVKDVSEAANYANKGVHVIMHLPDGPAYREEMARKFEKQMDEQAKDKKYELAQRLLQNMGYNPGRIDGIDGPRTDAAAADFAQANRLPPGLGVRDPAFRLALSVAAADRLNFPSK